MKLYQAQQSMFQRDFSTVITLNKIKFSRIRWVDFWRKSRQITFTFSACVNIVRQMSVMVVAGTAMRLWILHWISPTTRVYNWTFKSWNVVRAFNLYWESLNFIGTVRYNKISEQKLSFVGGKSRNNDTTLVNYTTNDQRALAITSSKQYLIMKW